MDLSIAIAYVQTVSLTAAVATLIALIILATRMSNSWGYLVGPFIWVLHLVAFLVALLYPNGVIEVLTPLAWLSVIMLHGLITMLGSVMILIAYPEVRRAKVISVQAVDLLTGQVDRMIARRQELNALIEVRAAHEAAAGPA